jgi:DNA-binding MarR family transcriptional regulator
VHLTEAGKASVEHITEASRLSEQQAAEGLSEKDVRNLLKLLRAMDENLHAALPEAPRNGEKPVADEI